MWMLFTWLLEIILIANSVLSISQSFTTEKNNDFLCVILNFQHCKISLHVAQRPRLNSYLNTNRITMWAGNMSAPTAVSSSLIKQKQLNTIQSDITKHAIFTTQSSLQLKIKEIDRIPWIHMICIYGKTTINFYNKAGKMQSRLKCRHTFFHRFGGHTHTIKTIIVYESYRNSLKRSIPLLFVLL